VTEVRDLTRVQQVIAGRMTNARATVPEFEVATEVDMAQAVELRTQFRDVAGDQPAPSINDLIIKACALALRRHPSLNASYADDQLHIHVRVNIGIAVATDGALIVPTVEDVDLRPLGSIAADARRLADRARAGTVTPQELAGATFTVSNLGMYGMTAIRPIINAPQVAILGVGAIREVLALRDREVIAGQQMTLTLSCDHRAVYGAEAAKFLAEVRSLLQAPLRLTL
ncbi:MAG: 2-oxo acid dehydrogenase subunit E2, partial [Actinomycetota bacterium]|nr:2-oxo acid dehydrogenase subunit E2 [Actinomycetota bacterium]